MKLLACFLLLLIININLSFASKASLKRKKIKTYKSTKIDNPVDDFLYNKIFYTDEQCQKLNRQYIRLVREEEDSIEGIAHGENALPREFPYVAAIYVLDSDGNYTQHCTGSIITKRYEIIPKVKVF